MSPPNFMAIHPRDISTDVSWGHSCSDMSVWTKDCSKRDISVLWASTDEVISLFFFQWQKYMVKRHKITQQKYNSTQTQNCQPAFDHFKPNVPSVLSCCSSRHGLPSHPASYWLLHPQTHLCTSDERLVRLPRGKWPDFTSFWIVTEIISCCKCIYGTFYTTGHSVVYIHYVLYCQAYILKKGCFIVPTCKTPSSFYVISCVDTLMLREATDAESAAPANRCSSNEWHRHVPRSYIAQLFYI